MIDCGHMRDSTYDTTCELDEFKCRCVEVPGDVCRAKLFINGKKVKSEFAESYAIVARREIEECL